MMDSKTLATAVIGIVAGIVLSNLALNDSPPQQSAFHADKQLAAELAEVRTMLKLSLQQDDPEITTPPNNKGDTNKPATDRTINLGQEIRAAIREELDARQFRENTRSSHVPKLVEAPPTPEQEQLFLELQTQVHSPMDGRRLTMIDLSQDHIVNTLTSGQHEKLVSELVMGVNRGEFSFEEVFPDIADAVNSQPPPAIR